MKKPNAKIFIALLLTMVMLVFAGCQKAPKEEAKKEDVKPAANKDVILATTTSTQDSGLLDVLKPEFEKTGYNLKIIAVGTGAALAMGEKGEADVMLVHAPKSEKPLVDSGVGINYKLVMHNDFILVGPESDPAGIKQAKTTAEAMKMIYDKGAVFVSRGDDSGTHKKELGLWKEANLEPKGQKWYQESGTGMGQTLNIASEKMGYTLTDRATYLAQKDKVKLAILLEGDKSLLNIYHVMNVNPEKFSKVNAEGGKAFVDFMVSKETQDIISKFGVEKYGQPLFFPDAGKDKI